jgi:hypothetical protein
LFRRRSRRRGQVHPLEFALEPKKAVTRAIARLLLPLESRRVLLFYATRAGIAPPDVANPASSGAPRGVANPASEIPPSLNSTGSGAGLACRPPSGAGAGAVASRRRCVGNAGAGDARTRDDDLGVSGNRGTANKSRHHGQGKSTPHLSLLNPGQHHSFGKGL